MDTATATITEEKFRAYESLRKSGITNTFDLRAVCDHSGLSRVEALAIMKNYHVLTEQYPNVRKQ